MAGSGGWGGGQTVNYGRCGSGELHTIHDKKALSLSDQTSLFALLTFLLFKMSNIRPENSNTWLTSFTEIRVFITKLVLDFFVKK